MHDEYSKFCIVPEMLAMFSTKVGYTLGNVTAYRNAVTLQVTDTIRSYDLSTHRVPHGITVSCELYSMGFLVCYGSQKPHEGERIGRW
jgi:hypothetical protein